MKLIRPQTIEQTTEFSRASTATYYDADGVLQTAAVDELRIGYDPETLELIGPILEDAATNIIQYSEQFDNGFWGKTQTSIAVNAALSPDGSMTMEGFIPTVVNGAHYVDVNITTGISAGQVMGASVFVLRGVSKYAYLFVYGAGNHHIRVRLDLETGELQTAGDLGGGGYINSAEAVLIREGLWRLSIEGLSSASATNRRFRINYSDAAGNDNFAGDGVTPYIYAWGAQLENIETTSYIPTSGGIGSRAADIPGDMLTSSIAEDDHPEYDVGVTYGLGDNVISTTAHRIYESLQAGNLGNALPPLGTVSNEYWLDTGATNRWKMFDNSITSQSSAAEYLSIVIQTVGRVDSVALLNISASSVRITMEDATEGVVYDQTYSLIEESGIIDYYEYWFEPVTRVGDFAITDMDLYSDTTITITLSEPGGTVLCGAAIVGLSKTIGATRFGMSLGIQDYSVKITDEFGNKTILERVYSDKMSLQVSIPTASVVSVKKTLASYRATAIVYIATDEIGAEPVIAYGYFNDFNEVIDYLDTSVLNIEIESLT